MEVDGPHLNDGAKMLIRRRNRASSRLHRSAAPSACIPSALAHRGSAGRISLSSSRAAHGRGCGSSSSPFRIREAADLFDDPPVSIARNNSRKVTSPSHCAPDNRLLISRYASG